MRRIGLSTAARRMVAVKQRREIEICEWSRREMAIDVSSAVNKCSRDLSTAVWTGFPQWPSRKFRYFENRFIRHHPTEVGYTVDVADLLFTPKRDFLVKNNAQKIKVDDLVGKTIVLYIVPLDLLYSRKGHGPPTRPGAGETWDMIDAYSELLRTGGGDVEFVFVPVLLHGVGHVNKRYLSEEAYFHHLFSTMPFPAIPFSDAPTRDSTVVQTFSIDGLLHQHLPHWVVIDATNTVVATRVFPSDLFKLFGGAELYPLSKERISELVAWKSTVERVSQWDQLLASDTRDFLLSNNGDKVPISSLKGKLVGLYFCENIPHPPRMQAIKKVYEEAKSRGCDFEIVQITFHYHPFNAIHLDTDPTVQQCCEDVSWLTLPFKDPSCRKVQRILKCEEVYSEEVYSEDEDDEDEPWVRDCLVDKHWVGDSLVLIHPRQGEVEVDHSSGLLFEFAGAKFFQRWGIEGYPFTRPSLYKAEYELQKREMSLQSLFPPGEHLLRSVGDRFDLVDAVSQLSGKRVLVLFAPHSGDYGQEDLFDLFGNFISMLKFEYHAQEEDNVAEESKFEVVYVSTSSSNESSFNEFTKDMPWLVRPFSSELDWDLLHKVFKPRASEQRALAFNEQGELTAKADNLYEKKGDKLQFPFIDQDLEKRISMEVEAMCDLANCRS